MSFWNVGALLGIACKLSICVQHLLQLVWYPNKHREMIRSEFIKTKAFRYCVNDRSYKMGNVSFLDKTKIHVPHLRYEEYCELEQEKVLCAHVELLYCYRCRIIEQWSIASALLAGSYLKLYYQALLGQRSRRGSAIYHTRNFKNNDELYSYILRKYNIKHSTPTTPLNIWGKYFDTLTRYQSHRNELTVPTLMWILILCSLKTLTLANS